MTRIEKAKECREEIIEGINEGMRTYPGLTDLGTMMQALLDSDFDQYNFDDVDLVEEWAYSYCFDLNHSSIVNNQKGFSTVTHGPDMAAQRRQAIAAGIIG